MLHINQWNVSWLFLVTESVDNDRECIFPDDAYTGVTQIRRKKNTMGTMILCFFIISFLPVKLKGRIVILFAIKDSSPNNMKTLNSKHNRRNYCFYFSLWYFYIEGCIGIINAKSGSLVTFHQYLKIFERFTVIAVTVCSHVT